MPDAAQAAVECAVCGGQTVQSVVPTDVRGLAPPDFDTRPGGAERGDVADWVAECPQCGYCADDLTRAEPGVDEIVGSDEYRARADDRTLPEAARRFLCYALILEKLHRWADAGWTCLHAAWACDDAGAEEAAAGCRAMAIERWKRAKEIGQNFGDDLASEFALVTDVYRRIGAFEEAIVACAEGLDLEDIPPAIEQMLRRQMVLIQRRDTASHSMSELQAREPDVDGQEERG